MSRPVARNLVAVAIAAALTTSATVAFAAAPTDNPSLYLKKQKSTTLVGLSRELQQSAIQKARSRPNAPKLTTQGGTSQAGPSDRELDLICGEWFVTWEEDADGDPILGIFTLHCAGDEIPLP
jgi:hypothetical protein